MALKLAVQQAQGRPRDIDGNLRLAEQACRRAAAAGARLILFSELFMTGYWLADDARRLAVPRDSEACDRVRAMAVRHRIAVCMGYPERAADAVHNSALLVAADGVVRGHYRKRGCIGDYERACFAPGRDDLIAEIGGLRIGVLICYDFEFPEHVRRLALNGVELLLVPTALSLEFAVVADKMVPTRAFENGIFIGYADHGGAEDGKRYAGGSCICAPDGRDLARAVAVDELLVAEIDPARYRALRERLPYLRDCPRATE